MEPVVAITTEREKILGGGSSTVPTILLVVHGQGIPPAPRRPAVLAHMAIPTEHDVPHRLANLAMAESPVPLRASAHGTPPRFVPLGVSKRPLVFESRE